MFCCHSNSFLCIVLCKQINLVENKPEMWRCCHSGTRWTSIVVVVSLCPSHLSTVLAVCWNWRRSRDLQVPDLLRRSISAGLCLCHSVTYYTLPTAISGIQDVVSFRIYVSWFSPLSCGQNLLFWCHLSLSIPFVGRLMIMCDHVNIFLN